jgi:hypothetical protein
MGTYKRYMTASKRLNQAPESPSGTIAANAIDGEIMPTSSGSVLVPSGPHRGVWNVTTGPWSPVATGADAPHQVQVSNGLQNGLWILPEGHNDASAYASPA